MEKPDLGQRLREAWKVFLFWRWERSFKKGLSLAEVIGGVGGGGAAGYEVNCPSTIAALKFTESETVHRKSPKLEQSGVPGGCHCSGWHVEGSRSSDSPATPRQ